MDELQKQIIDKANGIAIFCDGEKSFVYGEFNDWQRACLESGKFIPPSYFKRYKREGKK